MFKHILLAIDDSASAAMACSFTVALATSSGGDVEVIHVHELSGIGRGYATESVVAARSRLSTALADLREAGISASGAVATASAAAVVQRIAAAAERCDADVIVVGSSAHRHFHRLRHRKTRERLSRLTTLPVIIAPPPMPIRRHARLDYTELLTPRGRANSSLRA